MAKKRRKKERIRELKVLLAGIVILFFSLKGFLSTIEPDNPDILPSTEVISEGIRGEEPKTEEKQESGGSGTCKIHFIDVGQALSVLIEEGETFILYDSGNYEDEDTVKKYLDMCGVNELSLVVGSHPHEDHIGCMAEILNEYDTKLLWMPDQSADSVCYEKICTTVNTKQIKREQPPVGKEYQLSDKLSVKVIGPLTDYEDPNNDSIVLLVSYMGRKLLLTGDSSQEAEKDIYNNDLYEEVDILQVGHHGSDTATGYVMLRATNPKYAVISCGKDNRYGHPTETVLSRLNDLGSTVYRTDTMGTIIANITENEISFNVKGEEATGVWSEAGGLEISDIMEFLLK